MSRATDLSSIDATVERETVTFDFGRVLAATATIVAATITCVATQGIDGSAASRIIASPAIIASPSDNNALQAVAQMFGGMVAGEIYRVSCLAQISDGQVLNSWTHWPCIDPN